MLVVFAVMAAAVYLAEESRRRNQQRVLDAQFETHVRAFLTVEEAHSNAIKEQCRALSHSVRLQAALEEHDVEDLYQNAVTVLQSILDFGTPGINPAPGIHASFFRFFDASGVLLSTENPSAGLIDRESLDESLVGMGNAHEMDDQSVGLIALARSNQPSALREVVLTRIRDSHGRNLGALAVGFPAGKLQDPAVDGAGRISSGIWINRRLYIDELDPLDRHVVAERVSTTLSQQTAGHFLVELKNGPNLLYYKALNPGTQFSPAYQGCGHPLDLLPVGV